MGSNLRVSALDRAVTPNPYCLSAWVTSIQPRTSYQWRIIHIHNNDTRILRAVLAESSDVGLGHVGAIEERHHTVLLDPHLVARMGSEDIQSRKLDSELSGLGELSDAGSEGEEVGARDAGCEVRQGKSQVVYSAAVETENIAVVGIFGGRRRSDQVVKTPSSVIGQLLEQSPGFLYAETI